MMESPYFRSPYSFPMPSSSSSRPKKVVSIPIYFVDSEKSRLQSALKIQKTFRGFRVRKNVKKIIAIRQDVEEVEKKVQERETIELIKKDAKERLKVNESLMALLLKLDSVHGVDDGVRDLRKSVIKKAIILQEKIDSDIQTDISVNEGEIDVNFEGDAIDSDKLVDSTDDTVKLNEGEIESSITDNTVNQSEIGVSTVVDTTDSEKCTDKKTEDEVWECVEEETDRKSDCTKRANDDWFVVGGGEERERSKGQLLEKMVEDNQKLMAMVEDLCQKNTTQASLISSLSQRVELLEKAMNERSMRKKKKMMNATINGFVHP